MTDSAKRPTDQVGLHLPSAFGYERIARSAVETLAELVGFSPERIEDVKTAVAEACMNAIEHGNQLDRATSVTVLVTAGARYIEISVADEGKTPMPDHLPEPGRMDEGGNRRGLGMLFIRQLVDEMEITQLPEGGNQVRMVIYLTPAGKP
jgi:serine/threonine-protein kinase RsbW